MPSIFSGLPSTSATFQSLISTLINTYANPIISLLVGVAVVVFFIGILRFMTSPDEMSLKRGRELMLWGIIALFVMVSFWGLVGVLRSTFFGNSTGCPYGIDGSGLCNSGPTGGAAN